MDHVLIALARFQQSRAILEALQQHRSFSHVSFQPRRRGWSFFTRRFA